jgi:isoquinoline 1-oxidoreductase subunit alpha
MKSFTFILNGKNTTVEVDPDKPLLWVLREDLGLTGTKYGCGMAICGCCTVHLDGDAVRSCVTPISRTAGKSVTTIAVILCSERGWKFRFPNVATASRVR